jgi:hypothetical protein
MRSARSRGAEAQGSGRIGQEETTMQKSVWALGGLLVMAAGCTGGFGRGSASISGACRGDLGGSASAQKVEVFIASAAEFTAAAAELQTGLYEACASMGRDLGIPAGELGTPGVEGTRVACERVSRQLRADLTDIRAAGDLRVELAVRPPQCEVSLDAYGRCAAECDASFTPGQANLRCEGGELRGGCSAQCTGTCAMDVSARCDGTCEGVCNGTLSGDRCDGVCQGRCVSQVSGQCSGECRGGCSVEFQQPRCTGTVTPPQASADCRAACDARLDAHATCTPGGAVLNITGNVSTNLEEKVRRLRAALAGGFGQVLVLRGRVERVARSGAALSRSIGELPGVARSVGISAAACATSAVASTAQAMASVNVSVQVSVQVSGSVQVQ